MADVADAIQWGTDELFQMLTNIQQRAEAERAQASMNNQAIIDLNAQAAQITDPTARATFLAWVQSSVQRQDTIGRVWRDLSARFADLAAKVKAWLESVGLSPDIPGLQGLGQPLAIVVPVSLALLALAAWAAVSWMHAANAAQVQAIQFHQQALAALVGSGASAQQLVDFANSANTQIQSAMPKGDPFGNLMNTASTLLWLGGLAYVGWFLWSKSKRRAYA